MMRDGWHSHRHCSGIHPYVPLTSTVRVLHTEATDVPRLSKRIFSGSVRNNLRSDDEHFATISSPGCSVVREGASGPRAELPQVWQADASA